MSSCKTKGYIITATKKRKKAEDRIRRGILAMNGTCAQNNAPKVSRDKRNRLKKRHEKKKLKTEKEEGSGEVGTCAGGGYDNDNSSPLPPKKKKKEGENNNDSTDDDDDLQLALNDISKQTRQVAPSSSLPIAPPCVIKRKPTKNKKNPSASCSNRRQVSLPLETLRSATLRLQYPLQSSILKRKKKHSDVGQPRLITTSIDIIRCLLAESNWALMRRKNPTASLKLWFSTHDTLTSFLNTGDYDSANEVLVQLNKVSIDYGLRESVYFELLGDACNSLFGNTLLHNKLFDPDLVSINQQKLTGDKNTNTKTVLKLVYQPIWAKISERLNMITCGAALIGGKGDIIALQRCADNVLNKTKNERFNKIIKEVTARTNQMAKFGVALKSSSPAKQQQQQQQQPLLYPYPPPMFYTNGGLKGFNNNTAAQAAFAGLPQFAPEASSASPTTTATAAPPQPNFQSQSGNAPPLLPVATSTAASFSPPPPSSPGTSTTSTTTTSTGLHFSAPILFPYYPEEKTTTKTPSRDLQRNLLQVPGYEEEEEEEEEEESVISSGEEKGMEYVDDEMW